MSKHFMWLRHNFNYNRYEHTRPHFAQHQDYFGLGLFVSLEQIENIPDEINKGFSQSNIQKARRAEPGTVIKLHKLCNGSNMVLMCVSESQKQEIEEAQERARHLKEHITALKQYLASHPAYQEMTQTESNMRQTNKHVKELMNNILSGVN